MKIHFWRAASWHPLLAVCLSALPGPQLNSTKGSQGFLPVRKLSKMLLNGTENGGQEKTAAIRQYAHQYNAPARGVCIVVPLLLWSLKAYICITCVQISIYICYISLVFILWSQKGILILKSSQWTHAHIHIWSSFTHRNIALPAPT